MAAALSLSAVAHVSVKDYLLAPVRLLNNSNLTHITLNNLATLVLYLHKYLSSAAVMLGAVHNERLLNTRLAKYAHAQQLLRGNLHLYARRLKTVL